MTDQPIRLELDGKVFLAADLDDLFDQLLAFAPPMVGATDVAAGERGTTPANASGTQRRALRGDGTWSNELELAEITKADGTPLVDVLSFGDADDRLYLAAAASTGEKARLGTRSNIDTDVDLQLEPKGVGSVTHYGDALLRTMRPTRFLAAVPFSTELDRFGFGAPVLESSPSRARDLALVSLGRPAVDSPGADAAPLQDANGSYVSLTYDRTTPRSSGISIPAATQRRFLPSLLTVHRTALTESRFWFGLFSHDPSGFDDLTADPTPISTLTGVYAVDGTLEGFTRNDAGDFRADGWLVGDYCRASGFALSAANAVHLVTSVSASFLGVSTNLATESTPTGAVTLRRVIKGAGLRSTYLVDANHFAFVTSDGTTQTMIESAHSLTPNAMEAYRVRWTGSVWQAAFYNFTTQAWEQQVSTSASSPANANTLGAYLRLGPASGATANRAISPKVLALRGL